MYKLTFKKSVWLVKQYKNGVYVSKLALAQSVSRWAVYKIIKLSYKTPQQVWDENVNQFRDNRITRFLHLIH